MSPNSTAFDVEEPQYCVELANVGKFLGQSWVFRGINAKLPHAQVTAIIGASGSGKTTLLRLINAMYQPDEGSLLVMGEAIPTQQLHSFRRKIGYAVQSAGLFPHMTVESNITQIATLENWSRDRIEQRLATLMELTDLDLELKNRYPFELSGGQQHRVGLCRALMLEPQLLLLDEPFAAIDAITRFDIQHQFRQLQQDLQFSAVLVTHDLREAQRLSDHVLVLVDGQIVQQGPIHDVLSHPDSPFLKSLIESSA